MDTIAHKGIQQLTANPINQGFLSARKPKITVPIKIKNTVKAQELAIDELLLIIRHFFCRNILILAQLLLYK